MTKEQPPNPARPQGRPRSERARTAILSAARRILDEGGIEAVTTKRLLQESGVSPATVYRWWPSKEAVIVDAFLDTASPPTKVKKEESSEERLRDHFQRGVKFLRGRDGRAIIELIAEGVRTPAVQETLVERFFRPWIESATAIISEGIKDGTFAPDTDPETLVDCLYGPLYFRALLGHKALTRTYTKSICDQTIAAAKAREA